MQWPEKKCREATEEISQGVGGGAVHSVKLYYGNKDRG